MSNQIQDFKLPSGWENAVPQNFESLATSLEQIHKNAYSASVKAVNRLATVRSYLIGFYIVVGFTFFTRKSRIIWLAELVRRRRTNLKLRQRSSYLACHFRILLKS